MNRVLILALASSLPCCSTQEQTGPTWSRLTNLPAVMTAEDAAVDLSTSPDGYLYAAVRAGKPFVISVFRAPVANPASWQEITGKGLPSATPGAFGYMPNGTVLVTTRTGPGNGDVFFWNGSADKPVWSRIKGWTGESSSKIYNFTNDSAGYTYFSPAWSGVIWRNDHPNSLRFTQITDKLYSITHGGGKEHPDDGGLYQLEIWDLGDGKGDMVWTCGEGELDNISLKFTRASNTAYLTEQQGYKGNCTSLARSATTILVFRTADEAQDTLNSIDIATRAVTIHPSPTTRTETSFPYNISTNAVGILHWMSGNNFMMSGADAHGSPRYLLLSKDDGKTWIDITATGAMDSSCKDDNLTSGAVASTHYIFARCQSGKVLWRYGPVD